MKRKLERIVTMVTGLSVVILLGVYAEDVTMGLRHEPTGGDVISIRQSPLSSLTVTTRFRGKNAFGGTITNHVTGESKSRWSGDRDSGVE